MSIRWAYGVTTTLQRIDELLPQTLSSLQEAGFAKPHLHVDGDADGQRWMSKFDISSITMHYPSIRTFGSWETLLRVLFFREPNADRYAIFQDDLLAIRNLRQYLEKCEYKEKTYWNCYSFPSNEKLALKQESFTTGWYDSNQQGKGAVGLVFSREAVLDLTATRYMAERPMSAVRGHKSVDGGIVSALKEIGYKELCHRPSLLQHTGMVSSMGNRPQPQAPSFPGQNFDALSLLGG